MKLHQQFIMLVLVICTLINRASGNGTDNRESSSISAISNEKLTQKGVPRIRFDKTIYDFGTVKEGDDVSVVFKIRNDGYSPLKISDVKVSCACTAVFPSGKEIAPGADIDLEVIFHSKGYRGKIIKKIFISSNDPHRPVSQLTIKAVIKTRAFVVPQQIFLSKVHVNREVSREVILRNGGKEKLKIFRVESSSPYISTNFMPDAGSYEGILKVKVTLKPGAPLGRFKEKIRIYTNNKDLKTAEIPVNATIVGDISVFPEKIFFGFLTKGKTVRRRLVVTNTGDKPIKISKVASDQKSLFTQIKTLESGRKFEITVSLTPQTSDRRILTQLNIYTDSSLQEVIPVEIYGLVRN